MLSHYVLMIFNPCRLHGIKYIQYCKSSVTSVILSGDCINEFVVCKIHYIILWTLNGILWKLINIFYLFAEKLIIEALIIIV